MASSQPPSSPVPAGETQPADASAPAAALSFDEKLRQFWSRNRVVIISVFVIVVVSIVGKGLWEIIQDQRENSIAADYAKLTSDDQLKSFAADREGHLLGGVAYLRLADNAYSAGKFADAVPLYAKASDSLKGNILAHRAVIGGAVSKVMAGDRSAGEAALKAIASDLNQPASTRAEATYHLAVLASTGGDDAALQGYVTQISTLSPQSVWAQRAATLRAEAGLAAAPAASAAATAMAPASTPKADDAPKVTFPSSK